MPELPEVEVVRRGLAPLAGSVVESVEVLDARAITRHPGDAADFEARLTGAVLGEPARRGKFLWVPITGRDEALLIHLGMSGQILLQDTPADKDRHLRLSMHLARPRTVLSEGPDRVLSEGADSVLREGVDGAGRPYSQERFVEYEAIRVDFVDQRTFGSLALDPIVDGVPEQVTHIARDPLDPAFDDHAFIRRLRAKRTEVKRALLDQTLISGVGNIYADEALWGARMHPRQPTERLSAQAAARLLGEIRLVMERALAEGGTSFDSLYVNVNGRSGYFSRSLRAYAKDGEPCERCGRPMVRETFMNRGSHFCAHCQRLR